jgi:hypothetical protein
MPIFIFLMLDFVFDISDVHINPLLLFDISFELVTFLLGLLELLLLKGLFPGDAVKFSDDQVESSLELLVIVVQLAHIL